ncbi:MAG: hypothetical protein AAFX53_00855 [Bacteroidota bacterium]
MEQCFKLGFLLLGLSLTLGYAHAQEDQEIDIEESAEVFLEDYSDAFQETFFEALKQKGIENYDRAVNLLLECKLMEPDNEVLDHELARTYFADKKYVRAQEFAQNALLGQPANYWYARTLVQICQKQGSAWEQLEAGLPMQNERLRENLALAYMDQKVYKRALHLIQGMPVSDFSKDLSAKINDSIKKDRSKKTRNTQTRATEIVDKATTDPLEDYKSRIQALIGEGNVPLLEKLAIEAAESYPSQPFFQYAKGFALNKSGNHKNAITELEAALDLILDDVPLTNKVYEELAQAYTAMNNTSKANMYLRKIKPGF